MKRVLSGGIAVAIVACLTLAAPAGLIYQTGFDSTQGYVVGDITGQNGWQTYQPALGTPGFASVVTGNGPGAGDQKLQFNSGADANNSARYAWAPGYGAAAAAEVALGNDIFVSSVDVYLASGAASIARLGMINFNDTGAQMLGGFFAQQSTGQVYLLAYSTPGANPTGNYSYTLTGGLLPYDTWTTITTAWNRTTGRVDVVIGTNDWYVMGAGIGSNIDETDMYNTRNGGTVPATMYFDNYVMNATPEPGTLALLGLGLVGLLRRR